MNAARAGAVNPRAAAEEHVAAFNAADRGRLLAGFAPDAVWITGRDRFTGVAELAGLFDDGLWALRPRLEVLTLVADGDSAALRLHETLTVDGAAREFDIAVFLDFDPAGLIVRGQVYREGSADL
jgi:ketosteroid isomerase-like protein